MYDNRLTHHGNLYPSDLQQQILRGEVDAARLHEIQKQIGADVLITGEAFSQSPGRIGDSNIWNCRARVEVKVILLATGEIIAADAVHAAGNESTEELASKASLNNAGAPSTYE